MEEYLVCRGIKTHNLKNISLDFPLKKWIAVTGVSGSGKSSLVFDTIYAEAQRRFLETLGTYERQFLQGLPQGDFDTITNIPAAVALKQSNKTGDPRSVIATAADLSEPLRYLFIALMDAACVHCGNPVQAHKIEDLLKNLKQRDGVVLFSVPFLYEGSKTLAALQAEGYTRILTNGKVQRLEELDPKKTQQVQLILDRIAMNTPQEELHNRVESVWSQIRNASHFHALHINQEGKEEQIFRVQPYCSACKKNTQIIQPSDLDWQSVLGACGTCHGLGNVPLIDAAKVVPDPSKSLEDGAIKPWTSETFAWMQAELIRECKKQDIPTKTPYAKLSKTQKDYIWKGIGNKKKTKDFVPIAEFFEALQAERYKSSSRILLARYRKYELCSDCQGARLGPIGRRATTAGKHFHELCSMEISELQSWLSGLPSRLNLKKKIAALHDVFEEVSGKISALAELGLGSAHLFRRCKSLSGGEYQRVLLARVIGNGLTDALYILDEPSIGLGQKEIPNLIQALEHLRDLGNTILMVEHEKQLIEAADHLIELGPGGGSGGGELQPPRPQPLSLTLREPLPEPKVTKFPLQATTLSLKGFSALNCHNLDVDLFLGKLHVITGPSGAGKSTLLRHGIQAAAQKSQDGIFFNEDPHLDDHIGVWKKWIMPTEFWKEHDWVAVDQKAMHRSITSIPVTLLGLMDGLRRQFAATPEAKERGLDIRDFSFNGQGGCETCGGQGVVQDDLFFLGQVEKVCPDCNGTRYRSEVLEVPWQGLNIHQWLSLSFEEALKGKRAPLPGFSRIGSLACELGLGYLPLGLSTSLMSGGEAQRLRICAALAKSSQKLFCLLDEPTRGLSERDVGHLLQALLRLSSQGHTFVVSEHHPLFLRHAHVCIHMGPESGHRGGQIVQQEARVYAAV